MTSSALNGVSLSRRTNNQFVCSLVLRASTLCVYECILNVPQFYCSEKLVVRIEEEEYDDNARFYIVTINDSTVLIINKSTKKTRILRSMRN